MMPPPALPFRVTDRSPGPGLLLETVRRLYDTALTDPGAPIGQRQLALAWAERLTGILASAFRVLDRPRALEALDVVETLAREIDRIVRWAGVHPSSG